MQVTFALALVFAIAVALFAVQNTTPVTVSFLWFQIPQLAASVLVLLCAFLGAALTIMVGITRDLKRTLTIRSLRGQLAARDKRIQELEDQIARAGIVPEPPAPEPLVLPPTTDM